ncbi:MAG: NAD-dependent epimerase/dehydratase family protein [Candidatus Latescibacterota bacterium]
MKILVTGGAGFIASHVVDRYIRAGHEVVVVDDLSSGRRDHVHPDAGFHQIAIEDPGLCEVFDRERPDVVNHHAAQASVSVSVKDPILDARINVLGSVNLFEQCARFGVKKIIAISSGGCVYGDVDSFPISEEESYKATAPYGASKISMEYYLQFYRKHYGIGSTVLRYSNVYGPRQNPFGEAGVVAIFCKAMLEGKTPTVFAAQKIGDEGCVRDYVYVGDVAQANFLALEQGDGEAFNIGTGVATTVAELYRTLAGIAGYMQQPKFGPPRPGDILKNLLTAKKASALLGWAPMATLAKGLGETFAYFTTHPEGGR